MKISFTLYTYVLVAKILQNGAESGYAKDITKYLASYILHL